MTSGSVLVWPIHRAMRAQRSRHGPHVESVPCMLTLSTEKALFARPQPSAPLAPPLVFSPYTHTRVWRRGGSSVTSNPWASP